MIGIYSSGGVQRACNCFIEECLFAIFRLHLNFQWSHSCSSTDHYAYAFAVAVSWSHNGQVRHIWACKYDIIYNSCGARLQTMMKPFLPDRVTVTVVCFWDSYSSNLNKTLDFLLKASQLRGNFNNKLFVRSSVRIEKKRCRQVSNRAHTRVP